MWYFLFGFFLGYIFEDVRSLYRRAKQESLHPIAQTLIWLQAFTFRVFERKWERIRDLFPRIIEHHKFLEIIYWWKNKKYCIHVPIKSSSRLLAIKNKDNQNITSEVQKYLGPHEDFHGSLHLLQKVFTAHGTIVIENLGQKIELKNFEDFMKYFSSLHGNSLLTNSS